eukprot:GFUD01040171.1.p2 GENE.GFUD01040171.1~~GFUD01040171.1.p2  ORF type:complete len:114 (-),score=45.33 GFUD01040171.1:120-461(-)
MAPVANCNKNNIRSFSLDEKLQILTSLSSLPTPPRVYEMLASRWGCSTDQIHSIEASRDKIMGKWDNQVDRKEKNEKKNKGELEKTNWWWLGELNKEVREGSRRSRRGRRAGA